MTRISNYKLDCFALKVMALTANKSWGTEHFKKVVICHGNRMTAEETAKEVDAI